MEYTFTSLAHCAKLKAEHISLLEQLKDAEAQQFQAEGILAIALTDETSTPKQIADARKALPDAVQRADGLRHECISYVAAIDASLQKNRDAAVQEWKQHLAEIETRFNAAAMPLTPATTVEAILAQADALEEAHKDMHRLQRVFNGWYRQAAGVIVHLRPAMDAGATVTAIAQAIRNHQTFVGKQALKQVQEQSVPTPTPPRQAQPQPQAQRVRRNGLHIINR